MTAVPELSVVVPVFNEEAALQALFDRLYPALDKLGLSYEILFINRLGDAGGDARRLRGRTTKKESQEGSK